MHIADVKGDAGDGGSAVGPHHYRREKRGQHAPMRPDLRQPLVLSESFLSLDSVLVGSFPFLEENVR